MIIIITTVIVIIIITTVILGLQMPSHTDFQMNVKLSVLFVIINPLYM
ncbi:unnamed protein product [Brugia timori]|uniref:Neur_chan_memb domain-containing protein n=1 Tax=Brugia timori TaxID=42155 RepID=A0A0R3QQL9_9BILA|nr:unnamed protein product [Brugia timori]